MRRESLPFATLLAALAAAWQPSAAWGAQEDVQLWQVFNLTGALDAETRMTLDASQRWREEARGDEQQTLRITIERDVAPGVRIGGGAMVLEAGGNTELRPHQQVVFTRGRLEARTRLEQRFVDRADRMELRLRQRVQYSQPLKGPWRASLGGEWLGLLQSRNRGEGASTEQWRAQAGIAYRFDERLELGANYWLIVFPGGDGPDRISHVPQTVVTWRF